MVNVTMKNRIILHLDMDAFFAAIEERENPHFKGKPIVVGADPRKGQGRGVVSTANYEARKFGIHSAMPISKAYQLCPTAIFLPVNAELYSQVSKKIMNIIQTYSPLVEQTSLDEAYLDLTQLYHTLKYDREEVWERARVIAKELKRKIFEEERLTATCGIGPNKMIAKIACESAKPDGLKAILPEEVEKFFEPLDIEEIPGIGEKTGAMLRVKGVQTVGDAKQFSKEELRQLFGKNGEAMYERLRGIDEEPVIKERVIKSLGKEHTFEKDTRDPASIIPVFEDLVEEVAGEIQREGFAFRSITVVCRFHGFETHTKAVTLSAATADKKVLRQEAMKLLLRFITENPKPIRLVGLRVKIA